MGTPTQDAKTGGASKAKSQVLIVVRCHKGGSLPVRPSWGLQAESMSKVWSRGPRQYSGSGAAAERGRAAPGGLSPCAVCPCVATTAGAGGGLGDQQGSPQPPPTSAVIRSIGWENFL